MAEIEIGGWSADRMIRNYGYCEICSTDVLNFVASIFARGDVKD